MSLCGYNGLDSPFGLSNGLGWKVALMKVDVSISLLNDFQKCEVNRLSLSEMVLLGTL